MCFCMVCVFGLGLADSYVHTLVVFEGTNSSKRMQPTSPHEKRTSQSCGVFERNTVPPRETEDETGMSGLMSGLKLYVHTYV